MSLERIPAAEVDVGKYSDIARVEDEICRLLMCEDGRTPAFMASSSYILFRHRLVHCVQLMQAGVPATDLHVRENASYHLPQGLVLRCVGALPRLSSEPSSPRTSEFCEPCPEKLDASDKPPPRGLRVQLFWRGSLLPLSVGCSQGKRGLEGDGQECEQQGTGSSRRDLACDRVGRMNAALSVMVEEYRKDKAECGGCDDDPPPRPKGRKRAERERKGATSPTARERGRGRKRSPAAEDAAADEKQA